MVLRLDLAISELLDMPFASLATKLEIDGSKAVLDRDVQGGEVVKLMPIVLSAARVWLNKEFQT